MNNGLSSNTGWMGARLGAHANHVEGGMVSDPAGLAMGVDFSGLKAIVRATLTAAQLVVLNKQIGLARDYYNTNAQDYAFWRTTYQPRFTSLRTEVYAEARPTFDRFLSPFCYKMSGAAASREVDVTWQNTARRVGRYNTGALLGLTHEFAVMRHNAQMNGYNAATATARHKVDMYDERRHMRRLAVLNIGLAAGNTARAGLASSVGTVMGASEQLGSTFGALANGLSRNLGYTRGRIDTAERTGTRE